jgi:hypothetical protein
MGRKFRFLIPVVMAATISIGAAGVGSAYASVPGHVPLYPKSFTYYNPISHHYYHVSELCPLHPNGAHPCVDIHTTIVNSK